MKLAHWLMLPLLMAVTLNIYADSQVEKRSISIDLVLDQSLRQYADKPWVVYVFAKPLDSKVPVASKKLTLNQVPMRVLLEEKNFLLENLTLASVDKVTVAAKVTRHGSPHKTVVGDLLAKSLPIDFTEGANQTIRLVIDKEVD
ncbi:hypothetical protein BGP75_00190 [Motiliproteus sp. MSK22-1]|nr:hypothetical protein BGP75_00190 [Motiliproteus sp. MSK22-1]